MGHRATELPDFDAKLAAVPGWATLFDGTHEREVELLFTGVSQVLSTGG